MHFPKGIKLRSWAYLAGVAVAVAISASLAGSYLNGEFGSIPSLAPAR